MSVGGVDSTLLQCYHILVTITGDVCVAFVHGSSSNCSDVTATALSPFMFYPQPFGSRSLANGQMPGYVIVLLLPNS